MVRDGCVAEQTERAEFNRAAFLGEIEAERERLTERNRHAPGFHVSRTPMFPMPVKLTQRDDTFLQFVRRNRDRILHVLEGRP